MEDSKHQQDASLGFSLPGASVSDLRGKQSVRTTFKLSTRTIDAVSIVATHLGIKQKSLFDHLIEDLESLSEIADKVHESAAEKRKGVQKTYVISRKSLRYLERISKEYGTPRDILIEYSVRRLLPIINRERKKHDNRKKIRDDLRHYTAAGQRLLDAASKNLGEDDPVWNRLKTAVGAIENAYREVDAFVEKGSIIESF